jgi:hypothetical protein
MNLTDTFYVALCMTILILGVVYWFWTQNQYMQRKLNLLENIVFEIKTQIQKGDSPPIISPNHDHDAPIASESKYPPVPSSEIGDDEDLLDEDIEYEDVAQVQAQSQQSQQSQAQAQGNNPSLKIVEDIAPIDEHDHDDLNEALALQPGGVGSGIEQAPESDSSAKGSVLEGMTLKELQRLAEQKGINTTRLRKPQLIEAIRAHSRPSPFKTTETTLELS